MDEQTILEEIQKRFRTSSADRRRGLKVGVGDDAALVRIGPTGLVMTTDAVMEGVDFDLSYGDLSDAGYKALSAAVSDIYACGARPAAFLVTGGIPKNARLSQVRQLLSGLSAAAAEHQAPIVGGDITRSPKWFVDVCALGRIEKKFKTRSGARPGDVVCLSGPVGAARASLILLQSTKPVPAKLRRAQLRPRAPRDAGLFLGQIDAVTSMMDVSDGLLLDLHRLCVSSRVDAEICPGCIPVSPAVRRAFLSLGKNPVSEAAIGGEDYVLLFTVRPPVPKTISSRFICIGRLRPPRRGRRGGLIYNMERRPEAPMAVKGFLHRF